MASLDRQLLAQAVIIVGVCAGAWMLLVEPKVRELREVEAGIARGRAAGTPDHVAAVTHLATQASTIRSRVRDAAARSAIAGDTSRLYRRVMDLAAGHHVTVRSLSPRPAGDIKPVEQVAIAPVEMTAEGTYEDLARFFEALDGLPGFIRPSSLHISPDDRSNERRATASYTLQALRFALPEDLLAIKRIDDAP